MHTALVIVLTLLQPFASIFLICVGWLLAGDFMQWHKRRYPDRNSCLAALVVFAVYFAALMLFRYGPIRP